MSGTKKARSSNDRAGFPLNERADEATKIIEHLCLFVKMRVDGFWKARPRIRFAARLAFPELPREPHVDQHVCPGGAAKRERER